MGRQQFVILSSDPATDAGMAAIGTRAEIEKTLSAFNTGPERAGELIYFGPGVRLELANEDPVRQILMTITEEEIAWQVILRIGKAMHWKLLDPSTGRELTP
ncbi:MAG: hypothetical protein AB8G96_00785 [Phycisphaerales bacterium]